jgi:murein DD-endopeptidase MepM/ murein hydrolase activator NlpD
MMRAAIASLAIVTVVTGLQLEALPAAGRSELASRIAAVRASQERLESSMRARDRRVTHLKRDRAQARAKLRRAKARLADIRARRREARHRTGRLRARLSDVRVARARALPAGARSRRGSAHSRRAGRLARAENRLERRTHRLVRKTHRLERKERRVVRQRDAQRRRSARVGSRLRTTTWRRSGTQGQLASQIRVMTSLAKRRAARHVRVRPGRHGSRMRWPVRGTVSQKYGCTGFSWEPRRGSCGGFHDGIDIAAPLGTPVRAAASGVVAYVGWSPQGPEDRAFIVLIGHRRGLETLYGHLLPRRRVRAGKVVRKGEVIGFVGNTGRSTGPHLHWEVARGFRTMNPRRHL